MLKVEVMKESELPELFKIYSDPYIKKISHDHMEAGIISHPNAIYLSAKINDEIVGAFLAIRTSFIELELHSLLTKKALHKSRELGQLFLDWAFSNNDTYRVTVPIMQGLEKAKNYCIKSGMKLEGVKRDAIMKNKKLRDLYILGMTKKERIG
jgi:hypothetical protein